MLIFWSINEHIDKNHPYVLSSHENEIFWTMTMTNVNINVEVTKFENFGIVISIIPIFYI